MCVEWNNRERSICPKDRHTNFPQPDTSNLPQLQCFSFTLRICKQISPKDKFYWPFPNTTNRHNHTIKVYQEGSYISLQLSKDYSRDKEKDREELLSNRDWVIVSISIRECPSSLRTCTAPHRHASPTKMIFTSNPRKQTCMRTPSYLWPSTWAPTLMKYPASGLHKQDQWTHNTFLKIAMLLLITKPTQPVKRSGKKKKRQEAKQKEEFKEMAW